MSIRLSKTSVASLAVLLLSPLALTLSGCGESTIPVVPVSGKVTYQGKPAAGAQVVLHPVSADPKKVFSATGRVKDDGTFKIGVNVDGDGAPPGDYVATVQWFKLVQNEGGAGPGPNVLPKDYSDREKSPLKVTVRNEPTELAPFEVR